MKPLLISLCLLIWAPYAQGQQADNLKTDAQKIVSIISADQAKTRAYCQMRELGEQIEQAAQDPDRRKTQTIVEKINGLEKQLGAEYLALIDALNDADPNSKDVQDILSMFDRLDEQSCTH